MRGHGCTVDCNFDWNLPVTNPYAPCFGMSQSSWGLKVESPALQSPGFRQLEVTGHDFSITFEP